MKQNFKKIAQPLVLTICFIFMVFIVLLSNQTGQIDIKVGDVSTSDIYAPRTIIDETTTKARKKAARDSVSNVYICNEDMSNAAVENTNTFFALAMSLRLEEDTTKTADAAQLFATSKISISEESCNAVISASKKEFFTLRKISGLVEEIMTDGVSDVNKAISKAQEKINKMDLTDPQKNAAVEIIQSVVKENLEFDKEETERRKAAAESTVPVIEYKKNQIILRRGEVVSEAQLNMITQLGMLKGTNPFSVTYTLGIIILASLCYVLLYYYFSFAKKISEENLLIIALMSIITLVMVFYGSRYIPEKAIPIIPIAFFSCIVATFVPVQIAILSNIILSIFSAIVFDSDWRFAVIMILSGSICACCFNKVKRRNHLFPAAFLSGIGSGLVYFSLSFIEANGVKNAMLAFLLGFCGGLLAGILSIGTLPLWEWIFNATTPMKLTELANPENKLLKRLLIEAPGTYHHSLTVANIAEIAAREIKANALLARVGAYYHDIGKLKRPLYFKENQYNENAHDSLSPEESASVIINHVSDGVEIAQKHRLPKSICDIISQHHGTTTTGYFLIRAKEKNPEADVALFTYPGPLPKSKEAAIVMLADSCEAAVRSISDKDGEKIETMVRNIVTDRLSSGQLSECNLTFAELETIVRVIIKTLGGYFHERVKYE